MNTKSNVAIIMTGLFISASALAQSTATTHVADPSFNAWMGSQKGMITKQQYMNEAGRRWDSMDKDNHGLTSEQINSMYGYGPTPNMVKQSTNRTNPTGTERKGENSGGK